MGWFPEQPGGLNRHFRELHRALEKLARPHAVVLGPVEHPPATVAVPASHDDGLFTRLRAYARAAESFRAATDVVDAHFALYAALPVLTSLRRLPLVVHFQGPWADESIVTGERVRWRLAAKRLVERSVYRRAREAIVLSGAFKRVLVERYAVLPWRVTVVPPGVELDRFTPGDRLAARAALGLPDGVWVAVTVRRLVPRMGHETLLEAWRSVASQQPGALLLVVGEGSSRAALEAQAAQLQIGKSVRFVGRVPDEHLADWYRAADVSVVPSAELEGFGLVVLESLACGTPVVATDAGGLPEALHRLDPGLVVPAGDAGALGTRLTAALTGARPLPAPATCRAFAEQYSWDIAARRTVNLYERAVRPPRSRKPRVVYLDHCARLSGGELALLRLLAALKDVDPHVILGEDGPLVRRLLQSGISVEVFELAPAGRNLRRDRVTPAALPLAAAGEAVGYSVRLAAKLRRLRPDLVHTNSLKAALYGGVAARLAGCRLVWHIRDAVDTDQLPAAAVALVRQAARRLPHAVIANSRPTLESVGCPGTIVPSPVAVVGRRPASAESGHAALRVGIVGRIAPWKGQDVFLRAFAEAFPEGAERAVVVGAPLFGEERYRSQLEGLAHALGLDARVEFRGFREDVSRELQQLDVLVHASVLPEPFGQVVVEGMAAGLPVVAAAAGGPAEVIDDGRTGLLYPMGDASALAERLRLLAVRADLREQLGTASRLEAAAFSPERVAEQVAGVYDAVLARSRA